MTRPVVFAGPSLWPAAPPPGIDLRPPARAGDLLAAAAARPPAIGLIDGVFEQGPAVWHKEILAVLAAGVPVLGAASLGALRAAELAEEGMIGVGAVFAGYARGALTRDDAVMASHAPAPLGHRPLTLALVDAAAALAPLPPGPRADLLRIARRMPFRARTWDAIAAAYALATGRPPPPINRHASVKRDDALALIARIAGPILPPATAPPPETTFLKALRAGFG